MKNGAKQVAEATAARANAVLEVGSEAVAKGKEVVDDVQTGIAKLRNRLPASIRKTLAFDYGFATYENPSGKFNYVRPDGTFLLDASGKPAEFRHVSQFTKFGAVVSESTTGKYGLIDRSGKYLIKPEFDMIRDLSADRKIVSQGGKYFMMNKNHKTGAYELSKDAFDFISEPHQ